MPTDLADFQTANVQPTVHIAQSAILAGNALQLDVTPPAGTQALGFLSSVQNGQIVLIRIVGKTTGRVYFGQEVANQGQFWARMLVAPIAFDPTFEGTLTCVFQSNGAGATLDVFAIMDVATPATSAVLPMDVAITDGLNNVAPLIARSDGHGLLVSPTADLPLGKVGQQLAAASLPITPPSDLPLGKAGQLASAASLPVVLASDQPAIPGGAYRSAIRNALFIGPTKSGNANQATANLNTDLILVNLGNAPIIYGIDLVMLNSVTTGGAWATVRLHNATAAIDLQLAVLQADKNGSGFPYRTERAWIWGEQPLEPALVGGTNAQAWTLVVNASLTGVFWGCAAQYA